MQSEKIDLLVKALVEVQSKLKPANKNASNPFFKSKYADLESVWDSCRELLCSVGLAVIQTSDDADGGITLITTLAHESGQYISGRLRMNPEKNTPQGIGSAITYARRYALAAIIGIVTDDDDGNEASKPDTKPKPKAPPLDMPKGNGWWCSDWEGKAYILTKNKNDRFSKKFLDKKGFKLNEKTGTYSHAYDDALVDELRKMDADAEQFIKDAKEVL